ncbi:MAG: pimeloyl-ACP methyl ester esterase BioH [Candidatus Wenzhouxiangella sp. M2_3B_020]
MTPPDIATLHGWAMHGGLFDDLAAHWVDARWHRIDLPGHGLRRDDPWPARVEDLLDDLIARTPAGGWLMGWSLGGLLAMQAYLRRPDAFEGLVLVAATPCFVAREHWPNGMDAGLVKAMALELAGDPESVIQRFLALEIHGSAHARDELRRLKSVALRHGVPDKAALLAGLNHLAGTDLGGRLGEIDAPVLLIGGRRDKLVPWAALQAAHERLPDSRLVRVAGSAHAPFLTDPDATAEAIRDFVRESARV